MALLLNLGLFWQLAGAEVKARLDKRAADLINLSLSIATFVEQAQLLRRDSSVRNAVRWGVRAGMRDGLQGKGCVKKGDKERSGRGQTHTHKHKLCIGLSSWDGSCLRACAHSCMRARVYVSEFVA